MNNTTSVAITRDASTVLNDISKQSGLSKSYLADVAIKLFYSPEVNPNLPAALESLTANKHLAEQEFLKQLFAARV